jgi:hypothetical protein
LLATSFGLLFVADLLTDDIFLSEDVFVVTQPFAKTAKHPNIKITFIGSSKIAALNGS